MTETIRLTMAQALVRHGLRERDGQDLFQHRAPVLCERDRDTEREPAAQDAPAALAPARERLPRFVETAGKHVGVGRAGAHPPFIGTRGKVIESAPPPAEFALLAG